MPYWKIFSFLLCKLIFVCVCILCNKYVYVSYNRYFYIITKRWQEHLWWMNSSSSYTHTHTRKKWIISWRTLVAKHVVVRLLRIDSVCVCMYLYNKIIKRKKKEQGMKIFLVLYHWQMYIWQRKVVTTTTTTIDNKQNCTFLFLYSTDIHAQIHMFSSPYIFPFRFFLFAS